MVKAKRRARQENPFLIVEQFAGMVDALFVRYTGKTLRQHLQEPQLRPRELPESEGVTVAVADMPLADAYALLGLNPDAPLDQVKKNYRNLAKCFHPDHGGMNAEAMKLINKAYERITKGKRE